MRVGDGGAGEKGLKSLRFNGLKVENLKSIFIISTVILSLLSFIKPKLSSPLNFLNPLTP